MSVELESGELEFVLKPKGGESYEWHVDLITAKLTAEGIEEKHRLEKRDGVLIPTLPFLQDLAEAYRKLGAVDCTPTAAKSIWIITATRFLALNGDIADQLETLLK